LSPAEFSAAELAIAIAVILGLAMCHTILLSISLCGNAPILDNASLCGNALLYANAPILGNASVI
jgi:hypothetical protein